MTDVIEEGFAWTISDKVYYKTSKEGCIFLGKGTKHAARHITSETIQKSFCGKLHIIPKELFVR